MIPFVIYQLKCGKAKYVGSSNNFYKRRLPKHLKDLKENCHVNNFLQSEYNKGHKVEYKILYSGKTFFKAEILRTEQRFINKYANANEGVASTQVSYSRKEFMQDSIDFIVKNWKLVSVLLLVVLIVGFGMTTDQAQAIINLIVKTYNGG